MERKKERKKERKNTFNVLCPQCVTNKTGLQPVTKPVKLIHYLRGWGLVQSLFDAKAVQTDTLLAILKCTG